MTEKVVEPNIHSTTTGYGLVAAPAGMNVNTDGTITWTPAQTQSPSTNQVILVVTNSNPYDLVNPHLPATNSFFVVVREVNVPSTLSHISTHTVDELTALIVTNTATEPNIHSTTTGYGLLAAPAGMSVNTNGVISWTPTQTQSPTTNQVTLVVSNSNPYDLINPHLSATNSFTVIVLEVNRAPILSIIPRLIATESCLFTVTNTATEPNIHSTSSYTLLSAPAGMAIDSNGIITWMPSHGQSPSTNLVTTVANNYNPYDLVNPHLSVTNSFTVIVHPPIILTNLTWIATGRFQFTANSIAGVSYSVQYSTTLSNWFPMKVLNGSGDSIQIVDPDVVQSTHRFYRVKREP